MADWRDGDCPGIHACALCQEVIALRAHEATLWQEAHSLLRPPSLAVWDERRCLDCGWCHEEHAPDCEEAAINRRYEAALTQE